MNKKILKIGSLFCGCGGSDLGALGGFKYINTNYKKLPTQISYALDIDQKAINTYNHNFKHPAVVGSVTDVKPVDIPDFDILIGGFPCQSFSTVNPTKDPFDDRGQLYKDMAKILKDKQPKAFIAENVKGLMVLKKGEIFRSVLKEFEQQGYRLSFHLLNSANYGIPQRRQRVFIVGIRKDINKTFKFPSPLFYENPDSNHKSWVPLKQVIKSLVPDDNKYYFSKRAVEGMKNAKKNMKRGLWQDLEKTCLTITSHLAKVSLNSRDPVLLVSPKEELYRRFTPQEAASIQSFPENFKFVGSEADAYRQIGNAIPPVLMWNVMKKLIETLDESVQIVQKENKKELVEA